eukprot:464676-Prymnesium_polylepis.1
MRTPSVIRLVERLTGVGAGLKTTFGAGVDSACTGAFACFVESGDRKPEQSKLVRFDFSELRRLGANPSRTGCARRDNESFQALSASIRPKRSACSPNCTT